MKFIHLSDSHIGGDGTGYHRQVLYPFKMKEIGSALQKYLNDKTDIDFIMHAGDMIDSTTAENIAAAKEIFNLSIPTYLCLGNHDLTDKNSLKMWFTQTPEFFQGNKANFVIEGENANLIIAPTQWDKDLYFWGSIQDAHLKPDQLDFINAEMEKAADQNKAVIFITHAQDFGVPTSQTGMDEEIHLPTESYAAQIAELTSTHKNLRLILTAHSHINSRKSYENHDSVTPSSFCESPFEFKVITVTVDQIKVETHTLEEYIDFDFDYDDESTFVQADDSMRNFNIEL
ncbi:MAG: metallophosphoesterase family protein [Planctomycetota bacterium]|jgi:DNA repair exonuclease SbcCD nuclease subunit